MESRNRTFTARPICPFGAALSLIDAPELVADMGGAVEGIIGFLEQVVVDDQADAVRGAVLAVNADTAYACVRWLSEQYSGRPTVPSSGSAVSPPPDGRDSSSDAPVTATAA